MAKKTTKKPAGKPSRKPAPPTKSKTPTKKAAPTPPTRKAGPRSQPLPGFGQAVNTRLNNLCESIHESRRVINAERLSERGYIQAAMQELHRIKRSAYKFNGVELVIVPGDEKLRVRVTDDDGGQERTEEAEPGGAEELAGEPGDDSNESDQAWNEAADEGEAEAE